MSRVNEKENNIQCNNCDHINNFRIKGRYIKAVGGMSYFIPTEPIKEKICEVCGGVLII